MLSRHSAEQTNEEPEARNAADSSLRLTYESPATDGTEFTDEMAFPADIKKCANERLFQEMARNAGRSLFETATSRAISRGAPGDTSG
jgi:hypothetical protein